MAKTKTKQSSDQEQKKKTPLEKLMEKYVPGTPEHAEKLLKRILTLNREISKMNIQTLTPCFYGFTGVGKTSIVTSVVREINKKIKKLEELGKLKKDDKKKDHKLYLEVLLLQSMLPEDVLGIPKVVELPNGEYVTKWTLPEWFRGGEKNLALFLDEIDKARPETRSTILTLLASKTIKNQPLTPDSIIVAAMQPVDLSELDSDETGKALLARLLFIPINTKSSLERVLREETRKGAIKVSEDPVKGLLNSVLGNVEVEKISTIVHQNLYQQYIDNPNYYTLPLLTELSPRQLDYAIALSKALDNIVLNKQGKEEETDILFSDEIIEEYNRLLSQFEEEKARKEAAQNVAQNLEGSSEEEEDSSKKTTSRSEEEELLSKIIREGSPSAKAKMEILMPIYLTFLNFSVSARIINSLTTGISSVRGEASPIGHAKEIYARFLQSIEKQTGKKIEEFTKFNDQTPNIRRAVETKFVNSLRYHEDFIKNGGLAHISQILNNKENKEKTDKQKLVAYMYCILLKYAIIKFDYDGLKQTLETQFNTLKDVYMPKYKKEHGRDAILFFGDLPVDDMKEIFEEKLVEAGIAWVLKYDREHGKNREQFKKLLTEIGYTYDEKALNNGLSEASLIEKNMLEGYDIFEES